MAIYIYVCVCVVGRTVYDTRKSPIITLYEPSVGLFIHHHITSSGTFIHDLFLGTLTRN